MSQLLPGCVATCSLATNTGTLATLSQCQSSSVTKTLCLPGYSCTSASLSNQANACAVGKYSAGGQPVRTPCQTRTCCAFVVVCLCRRGFEPSSTELNHRGKFFSHKRKVSHCPTAVSVAHHPRRDISSRAVHSARPDNTKTRLPHRPAKPVPWGSTGRPRV